MEKRKIWISGEPPNDGGNYLLKFNSGVICTAEYRYGRTGEPQTGVIDWRCDCCGKFATPVAWMLIDR